MSYGLIDYNTLKDISDALRYKANTNVNYYPRDMARAINSLRTGGGFEEPAVYTMTKYYENYYDNRIIKRSQALGFETTNVMPVPNSNEANGSNIWNLDNVIYNVNIIDEHAEWAGMSPDNVIFYEAFKTKVIQNSQNPQNVFVVGGFVYGLCTSNKWLANQISAVSMENMFSGCYNEFYGPPYCGRYTTSLKYAYNYCQKLTGNAVCGPYVQDMDYAYNYCDNLTYPACGNNVTSMDHTYYSCYNLVEAIVGPRVSKLNWTYGYCRNIRSDLVISSNITYINAGFISCDNIPAIYGDFSNLYHGYEAFNGCNNAIFSNVYLNNLQNGYGMFGNCKGLINVESLPNIVNGSEMFYNCTNLVDVNDFTAEHITEARYMFSNCCNLNTNIVNTFLETFNPSNLNSAIGAFTGTNVTDLHITSRMGDKIKNAFVLCPLDNVIIDDDVTTLAYMFVGSNIKIGQCPPNVNNLMYAYYGCREMTDAHIGDNVNTAYYCFFQCNNLVNVTIDDNTLNIGSAFSSCGNLQNAVCGNNTVNMQFAYRDCPNLVNAVCGPNVVDFAGAYYNCPNIVHSVSGPLVGNMCYSFLNGHNLIDAVVGNNVYYMYETFRDCENIVTDLELFCTNLYVIQRAFYNDYQMANFYMATTNFISNNQRLQQAFFRSNHTIRRNIVMANINAWRNLTSTYCQAFGGSYMYNETYQEPVEVNVNNNIYNVIRCAYNTYLNTYVYCME